MQMLPGLDPAALRGLSPEKMLEAALIADELLKRQTQRQFFTLFPSEDTLQRNGRIIHARTKYPKHLEFFEAGAKYRERCFMAGNRIGKTTTGSYELTCHLTGLYPDWWVGRRFNEPVRAWACGKKNETTRDIVQAALLGEVGSDGTRKVMSGTGMVPGQLIGKHSWKQGVQDLVDTAKIKHASGGWSTLGFKSYEQGRGSFEGTAQHVIWLDEECPIDVYGECLMRLMTTDGCLMLTFSPLDGLTETVMQFMPSNYRPSPQ